MTVGNNLNFYRILINSTRRVYHCLSLHISPRSLNIAHFRQRIWICLEKGIIFIYYSLPSVLFPVVIADLLYIRIHSATVLRLRLEFANQNIPFTNTRYIKVTTLELRTSVLYRTVIILCYLCTYWIFITQVILS